MAPTLSLLGTLAALVAWFDYGQHVHPRACRNAMLYAGAARLCFGLSIGLLLGRVAE